MKTKIPQMKSSAGRQQAGANSNTLTSAEKKLLTRCETTIRKGKQAFLETGKALATIHDQRLYRSTHKTFAAYCEKRWGFTAKHCYGFIAAYEVEQVLAGIADKKHLQPKKINHFLALKGLDAAQVSQAMTIAAGIANAARREVRASDLKAAREQVEASQTADCAGKINIPPPEPVNLPIVEPGDILHWVEELGKQLQDQKIKEAVDTLNRIRSAIAAWIQTEKHNQKAA